MSVEEKIDILFYLFGVFLVLHILALGLNIKRFFLPKTLQKYCTRVDNWDRTGQYEVILDHVDRYIAKFPNDINLTWMKARALYKLQRYEEARKIFVKIADSEPMWKDDSIKYIQDIDEKSSISDT